MSELVNPAIFASSLKDSIPEQCKPCFAARMSGDLAGQYFSSTNSSLEQASNQFTDLLELCEDGHSVIGECGEQKSECAHPLGARALAHFWSKQ